MSLNILTVKVGPKYTSRYVNAMYNMLDRHLKVPFHMFCITDDSTGLSPNHVTPIKPPLEVEGWWNKIAAFSPHVPTGKTLYMDLDQIILGDITNMVFSKKPMSCYADHIEWCGVKFGSAMMVFKPEEHYRIWNAFVNHKNEVVKTKGGDQVFISKFFSDEYEVDYLNERFPGEIQSFKFDLKRTPPADGVKIVNFHGNPKPHDIMEIDWVRENWR